MDVYIVIPDSSHVREIDAMKSIRRAVRSKKTMPLDIVVSKENKFNQRKLTATIERQIVQEGKLLLYG